MKFISRVLNNFILFSAGILEATVNFNIPFFQSHKCIFVASTDPSTLTTTTISTSTTEEETTDSGEEETTLPTEELTTLPFVVDEAEDADEADVVSNSLVRRRRQLNTQLGNANLGDGDSQVEKHQYDVKHIANQVDTGNHF